MSGHSKWSTIKRAKGAADAKRSQLFTKLAKAISVAARDGDDSATNSKLRLAIDRARSFNMPKDSIERAVQKGAGMGEGNKLEEVRYEAYGPGGVALLIDTLTDNRNRTSAEIRHLLERHGGHMADAGSVAWVFELKGLVQITKPNGWEELELELIEAGVEDIQIQDNDIIITCPPEVLENIKELLVSKNITPGYLSLEPVSKNNITIDNESTLKLNELKEALEANDDVTNVYDNQE